MNNSSFPTPLFIFEMANNHGGNASHGIDIIRAMEWVTNDFPQFNFAVKFQYRDLDTLIHPAHRDCAANKHVKRFLDTRLKPHEFKDMRNLVKSCGMLAICTPFDEPSVDLIEEHGYDAIKIASCSLTDWPLLERIAKARKSVIASTAGTDFSEIDKVVSFFQHRDIPLALMHCVAEYPTPREHYALDRISALQERYKGVPIGLSTHESPDDVLSVQLAIAKGARIFEKHVAIDIPNAYSATPEYIRHWLRAASLAFEACACTNSSSLTERTSLRSLQRGLYTKADIPTGAHITAENCALQMPMQSGQLDASALSKYYEITAREPISAGAPVRLPCVTIVDRHAEVRSIVRQAKALLAAARIALPGQVDLEISHHYGIERFAQFGLLMITCVNRVYCKKLLLLAEQQQHPEQFHRLKEETFQLLFGNLCVTLDGTNVDMVPGQLLTIHAGVKHCFSSRNGAVIEEISTRHDGNDSYYTDPVVQNNPRRKTKLTYWLNGD